MIFMTTEILKEMKPSKIKDIKTIGFSTAFNSK
jgi:hypothetical protein